MGQFETRWYYAASEDAEHWYGAVATREEAIAAGRAEYPDEGFWVTAGTPMAHHLDVFDDDLDGVVCAFQNANEEMFGEDGQGDPENDWTDAQCKDLAARLNATFAQWARENRFDRAYMLDMAFGEHVPASTPDTGRK